MRLIFHVQRHEILIQFLQRVTVGPVLILERDLARLGEIVGGVGGEQENVLARVLARVSA